MRTPVERIDAADAPSVIPRASLILAEVVLFVSLFYPWASGSRPKFLMSSSSRLLSCLPDMAAMDRTQPLHPLFEKATHILQLSPTYKDTYDFTWVGKDCGDGISGGQIYEEMPFSGACMGKWLGPQYCSVSFCSRKRSSAMAGVSAALKFTRTRPPSPLLLQPTTAMYFLCVLKLLLYLCGITEPYLSSHLFCL